MQKAKRKKNKKMVKLEKLVGKSGKNGRIYLPKKWIGKKVKVILVH
jgi:putative transposon-encoded protein